MGCEDDLEGPLSEGDERGETETPPYSPFDEEVRGACTAVGEKNGLSENRLLMPALLAPDADLEGAVTGSEGGGGVALTLPEIENTGFPHIEQPISPE